MTTILFLLFFVLDFQPLNLPADAVEKQFVAIQLEEIALAECATNPQGGVGSQLELLPRYDEPLPFGTGIDEWNNVERMISAEGYRDGTAISSARVVPVDPPTPPKATVPEPPMFAILSITGALLLLLLYGQRLSRRLLRRI